MNNVIASSPTIPGFTSETASVGGVRLHYWQGGDPKGQPVLLWHGFLTTGYTWYKVAPALVDAGLSVLVPDMRGYGDSDKPAGTEGYDARSLAEEFRALVHQIGFGGEQPIILVAHDMGAPPALLWAADHPDEIVGLLYIEAPVMLSEVLTKIIAYTPEAMKQGSMWWWILPLAPDVPERLIVGNERAFLTWFYDRDTVQHDAITPETIDEYLRTFSGREGVLGALGTYRAAFTSIDQTTLLTKTKVQMPVVTLSGEQGLGTHVQEMVELVVETVAGNVIANCGHFVPEERPDEVIRHVLTMTNKVHQTATPSIGLHP